MSAPKRKPTAKRAPPGPPKTFAQRTTGDMDTLAQFVIRMTGWQPGRVGFYSIEGNSGPTWDRVALMERPLAAGNLLGFVVFPP